MIFGKITGNLVSTKKDEALVGMKLLTIVTIGGTDAGKSLVAVDLVGAGRGEYVIVSTGSAARLSLRNPEAPVDAAIIGIVDNYNEIEGINQ